MLNALEGRPLPIYGDGGNVRDWLHVDDHCAGILQVLRTGRPGEKYNIGGGSERSNLEVVDLICDALEERRPAASNAALAGQQMTSYRALKKFVPDRPGHDRRYAIDATKIREGAGLEAAAHLRSRPPRNRGLVSRASRLVRGHPEGPLRPRTIGAGQLRCRKGSFSPADPGRGCIR